MVTAYILISSFHPPSPTPLTVSASLKFVQERHPNCYPNKHFLSNLHALEKELTGHPEPDTPTTE